MKLSRMVLLQVELLIHKSWTILIEILILVGSHLCINHIFSLYIKPVNIGITMNYYHNYIAHEANIVVIELLHTQGKASILCCIRHATSHTQLIIPGFHRAVPKGKCYCICDCKLATRIAACLLSSIHYFNITWTAMKKLVIILKDDWSREE